MRNGNGRGCALIIMSPVILFLLAIHLVWQIAKLDIWIVRQIVKALVSLSRRNAKPAYRRKYVRPSYR